MITVDQTMCAGCAMCVTACRQNAIACFGIATVDNTACDECLECLDFCPTDALDHRDPVKEGRAQEAL
ncbi:MAG: 4Fe-4S ferredoxin [Proteobacteria bacterium]|nr:4Fe-4S ferredoxin [Pseudomonadota bacterium]